MVDRSTAFVELRPSFRSGKWLAVVGEVGMGMPWYEASAASSARSLPDFHYRFHRGMAFGLADLLRALRAYRRRLLEPELLLVHGRELHDDFVACGVWMEGECMKILGQPCCTSHFSSPDIRAWRDIQSGIYQMNCVSDVAAAYGIRGRATHARDLERHINQTLDAGPPAECVLVYGAEAVLQAERSLELAACWLRRTRS